MAPPPDEHEAGGVRGTLADDDRRFLEGMGDWLREAEPQLGRLIAAIEFKQKLVARFGLRQALELARPFLAVPGIDVLRRRPVASQVSHARNQAVFHELWKGGEPFSVEPPATIGDTDARTQHGITRSAYLTRFDDAMTRGRSAIVLVDGKALVDYENGELDAFPDSALLDPGVLHERERTYWVMEPAGKCLEVEEAFMLSGSHTNDFGHWITEYLPKLAIAMMAGLPRVPILVDQAIPKTHRQSLKWLLPDAEVIVVPHLAPVRVKRLWCASNPMYRGFYPQDWTAAWETMLTSPERFASTIAFLKSQVAEDLRPPTESPRVFLARKPTKKKRLVNHEAVEAIAAAHGFTIVHPEDLAFRDQVRLVHHARRIVAPDGSAGLLSYFAPQGGRVAFLNHAHADPLVELVGILRGVGVDFTVVTGEVAGPDLDEPFWNDYRIDERAFGDFLAEWCATDAPSPATPAPRHMPPPRPLAVASLQGGSALASGHLHGQVRRVAFERQPRQVQVARVCDVRYVPSTLLPGQSVQVIGDGCMPVEAVFDDFTPGFVRDQLLGQGVTELSGFEESDIAGDVCILGNVFSRNFTHWHEELMKLVVLEQGGFDCTYVISGLPAFASELLALFGIPRERVVEVQRPTRFRSALYTTPVSYRNASDYPGVLRALRQRLLAAAGPALPGVGPRLWLDRGKQTRLGRKLVNEEEVQRLLDRYGLQRLDMGALALPEQLAVARDMQLLAGLHGSQFVHSQLMAPRSWVVECFSPLYLNPTYTEIYRVLRHRSALLAATNTPVLPYRHKADVLVDCQQLDLALATATEGA